MIFKFIKDLLNKFVLIFYPNRCIFCNTIISSKDVVCKACNKHTLINPTLRCFKKCFGDKNFLCVSAFDYKLQAREAMRRFKFLGYTSYAKFFAESVKKAILKKISNPEFDIISYVPLSLSRERERGYNQSELIAKELGKTMNISSKKLLTKTADNCPQHTLALESRMHNVVGVYRPVNPDFIKGKTILLCDDILTTGNTICECAKILYAAGADYVAGCTADYVK